MGFGTPYIESLSGYIARLAENHSVSTGQLFAKELAPNLNRPYLVSQNRRQDSQILFRISRFIHAVNGTSQAAVDYTNALEKLTLQNSLRYMTLFPWHNVISTRFLLRRKRAWCPQCFYEDKETFGIVYEHLLWTIKFVVICIKHQISLISICPFCNKESSVLTPRASPGHCYSCGKWLGNKFKNTICDLSTQNINCETESQVSNIIGELFALSFKSKETIKNEIFNYNLLYCAKRVAKNDLHTFARFLEVEYALIYGLANNHRHLQLDSLIKIVKNLNISPEILFLQKLSRQHDLPQIETPRKLSKNDKLKILNKALIDPQSPSLVELAQKYGILSKSSLRKADAELCKQITARNRLVKPRNISPPKKHNTEIIEKELYLALEEIPPPPLQLVAEKLGYKIAGSIKYRCPQLSKQLIKKRSEYFKELGKKLEESLKKALNDFPPLPLETIAKKLGYKRASCLRYRFPELCRAISTRFKEYKPKFEIVSKALLVALTQNPPPTIGSISKSLNICVSSLYKCNSELCCQISERYRKLTKNTTLRRRKARHKMIRNIVLELHAKGVYPSQYKVTQLLPVSFNSVHDLPFLAEVRKSLGIN